MCASTISRRSSHRAVCALALAIADVWALAALLSERASVNRGGGAAEAVARLAALLSVASGVSLIY